MPAASTATLPSSSMLGRDAHAPQQLHRRRDVVQLRNVAQRHRPVGEQRGGEDRQRRVLRARDPHLAVERPPPTIASLSMTAPLAGRRARLPLFGRQRLERERVDLAPDARPERAVDHLMPLQAALARERGADRRSLRSDLGRPFARAPSSPAGFARSVRRCREDPWSGACEGGAVV